MNKAELIQTLEKTLPELSGKLSIERVLFRAADNKAYFSLLSDVLVDERAFLKLDSRLSSLFPGMHIALRVASPQLKDQFLNDIQAYTPVLKAFLRRQSPAIRTWLDDVGWSIADEQILLVCPDDFAVQFFKRNKLDEKLSQAVWDIFRLRMTVMLEKCGEREQWVERMRAEAETRKAEQHLDDRAGNPHLQESEAPARPAPASGTQDAQAQRPAKARAGAAIKGRAIAEKPVPIGELTEESGVVVVEGVVANTPVFKELKGGETALISFALGDETSTVFCKAFFNYKDRRSDEPPPAPRRKKSTSRWRRSPTARGCGCAANARWTAFWMRSPSTSAICSCCPPKRARIWPRGAKARGAAPAHPDVRHGRNGRRRRSGGAGRQMGASRHRHHRSRRNPGLSRRVFRREEARHQADSRPGRLSVRFHAAGEETWTPVPSAILLWCSILKPLVFRPSPTALSRSAP